MGRWLNKKDYNYTKQAFCCGHCGNHTIMQMISEEDYIKQLNNEDHTQEHYTWKVLVCPTCEEVNILEYILFSDDDLEFIGYRPDGEEQFEFAKPIINYLYPTPKVFDNKNSDFQPIRDAYEEAVRACKAKLYNLSVITCRKAVELLCKIHEIEEENLEKSLRRMNEEKYIDLMLYEWADALRFFGNKAVHTEHKFSKIDTEDIINFTYSLIEYCIDFRFKFTSLIQRQKATLSTKPELDKQIITLVKALNDSNKFIRYYAAENLTRLGVEADKVTPVLINLLATEKADFLKALEECLVRIGQSAISELIGFIKNSSIAEDNRVAAIRVLGKIGEKDASVVSELISLLDSSNLQDKNKIVIVNSIKKIGVIAKSTFIDYYEAKNAASGMSPSASSTYI